MQGAELDGHKLQLKMSSRAAAGTASNDGDAAPKGGAKRVGGGKVSVSRGGWGKVWCKVRGKASRFLTLVSGAGVLLSNIGMRRRATRPTRGS